MSKQRGFTLIEVLLALAVIAIALTALLKATGQSVIYTQRINDKTISHWVAMQGIAMIQLNLLTITPGQDVNQVTKMLGENWYWRAKLSNLPSNDLQQITITVSKNQSGPFTDSLTAYRFTHE